MALVFGKQLPVHSPGFPSLGTPDSHRGRPVCPLCWRVFASIPGVCPLVPGAPLTEGDSHSVCGQRPMSPGTKPPLVGEPLV